MTQAYNVSQFSLLLNTSGQLDATSGFVNAMPIANGATGQTTAAAARNALIPSQTGNSGKYLGTDATNTSWNTITTGITATTGSAPYYGCRAFVDFNGTGTVAIRQSYNVSSISDFGTSNYGVNFTTAMPDTNYSDMCGGGKWGDGVNFSGYSQFPYTIQSAKTTSQGRIYCVDPTNTQTTDPAYVSYFCYR